MLLAGGGPASPDPRVLLALTTPVIGQFDPAFTSVMDDVMVLARAALQTTYDRCFAVSSLAAGGLEAVFNSFVEPGTRVAIGGGSAFATHAAAIANRYGATVSSLDDLSPGVKLLVVPHIDPGTASLQPVANLATAAHALGARIVVDATLSLGTIDLRVDDWRLDVCVAGVDYGLGAPSGMSLVAFARDMETLLEQRHTPPLTSYLDLRQLQAYWSPQRLNHHTAPTSLVYGLREALRLFQVETPTDVWQRHALCGTALRDGLADLGLHVCGDGPYAVVDVPQRVLERTTEPDLRRRLREDFAIAVSAVGPRTWRIGLLAQEARPDNVNRVLTALERVLRAA